MSSYGSGSPREGDMDCYEPQFYFSGRPQYHSMQELHCKISSADGLHSPACHPALSEDDLSGPNEAYWRPQNGGADTPGAMGSFNGFGASNINGGYTPAQYGYEDGTHHLMASSSPSGENHYHQNQLYHFPNHYISSSTPTLSMDCDRSPSTMALHHQRQMNPETGQEGNFDAGSVAQFGAAPNGQPGMPFVRVVKRRNTANKKERRRTQSINTAFADLRECIPNVPADTKLSKVSERKAKKRNECINEAFSHLKLRIPNVPADTKLSKIKTLRLATSYISYLMAVLESDAEPAGGFRAELPGGASRRSSRSSQSNGRPRVGNNNSININNNVIDSKDCLGRNDSKLSCEVRSSSPVLQESKRSKGRTGWPQHVWALELKQEQNL